MVIATRARARRDRQADTTLDSRAPLVAVVVAVLAAALVEPVTAAVTVAMVRLPDALVAEVESFAFVCERKKW